MLRIHSLAGHVNMARETRRYMCIANIKKKISKDCQCIKTLPTLNCIHNVLKHILVS